MMQIVMLTRVFTEYNKDSTSRCQDLMSGLAIAQTCRRRPDKCANDQKSASTSDEDLLEEKTVQGTILLSKDHDVCLQWYVHSLFLWQ
jgi:hypothetical protein